VKLYGRCDKCQAPVFVHLDNDRDVYKVRSFRCWNGHYRSFENLRLATMPLDEDDMQIVATVEFLTD